MGMAPCKRCGETYLRRTSNMYCSPLCRLLDKTAQDPSSGCWEWVGGRDSDGYGHIGIGSRGKIRAHRLAYELIVGPIPSGLQIDHLCRNRGCVNPEHLEPVTPRINTLRGEGFAGRQARQKTCKRGHEFTPENTYIWAKRPNQRMCRACAALDAKERRRAKKQGRFDTTTARRELVADETLRIVAAVFPEQREAGEWS